MSDKELFRAFKSYLNDGPSSTWTAAKPADQVKRVIRCEHVFVVRTEYPMTGVNKTAYLDSPELKGVHKAINERLENERFKRLECELDAIKAAKKTAKKTAEEADEEA